MRKIKRLKQTIDKLYDITYQLIEENKKLREEIEDLKAGVDNGLN